MEPNLIQETPITEAERLDSMKPDAGVPNDTVVTSPAGEKERIIYEYDENNNVTGWHKEPVEGSN